MKRKYRSIGSNAILNAIRTGLSVIFPLITYPYCFRVLHVENIGKVNFASSIIGYFTLIASLGYSTYAVREGAKIRENQNKMNRFASQIFSMNLLTAVLSYSLLFLCTLFIPKLIEYKLLIAISSISIILSVLTMDWINTIYEDFLYITVRSIIAQIVILILMFIVVKNEDDYLIYAMVGNISGVAICFMNFFYCRKYVRVKFTLEIEIKKHLKPILCLFANSVATTIYVNSDVTMLGWMSGNYSVGVYSVAVKIYTVLKNIMSAIYTVAIPRISNLVGKNDYEGIKKLYSMVVARVILILFPASAGIISISKEIIFFMGGVEYGDGILTLQLLSISLIGAILGGLVTYCINIPTGKERINLEATSLSAAINIGLNFFMIPLLNQNGAAITTVLSEFFVFIYCIFRNREIRTLLDWGVIRKNMFHACLGMLMIFILSYVCHHFINNMVFSMIAIIASSVLLYSLELLILKNDLAINIINRIRR